MQQSGIISLCTDSAKFSFGILHLYCSRKPKEIQAESPWYILMNSGNRMYLLGKDGREYLIDNKTDEAMTFKEKIEAINYVEKLGLTRFATIGKVKN